MRISQVPNEPLIYLNGKRVEEKSIVELFEKTAKLPKKPTILLVADEDVSLKFVTKIVDLCRKNGLEDFRLQAR